MHDFGVTKEQLRDERYDAIIHMVTAADGAKSFFNSRNEGEGGINDVDEAIENDRYLRLAYMGH